MLPELNAGLLPGLRDITWLTRLTPFDGALQTLTKATRVAVDIEADSLYHYFEKVCLVQISTDVETFVVDTLAVKDLTPLAPLMANRRVEKVFHAASYDVGSLRRDYGFSFGSIFDTHLAAQLLGYEQLGLSALLEKLLRVVHSKHRQRDDWSRRPLEPAQLEYAAMDTHHLLELRDLLESQLSEKGRLQWASEEFEAAACCTSQEKKFDPEGFRRIKGSAATFVGPARRSQGAIRAAGPSGAGNGSPSFQGPQQSGPGRIVSPAARFSRSAAWKTGYFASRGPQVCG